MRVFAVCGALLIATHALHVHAHGEGPPPLTLLDVPFISQSEALCGGAAAAMVLRFWGEREVSADTFAHLVDRSAAGIRTDALVDELRYRGWIAAGIPGDEGKVRAELSRGRPVMALVEDRPSAFHYVVVLGWHDRGVVFHDPARGPFVVMSTTEFMRRWRAAQRWMAVVVPGGVPEGEGFTAEPAAAPPDAAPGEVDACEAAVADGVRHAQAGELGSAERILAASLTCPAAARELAGVRVLQRRWSEAEHLAATAAESDIDDLYAWRVLATSRFVRNDRPGALAAWNRAGEPRLDLIRVDGLTRTRHRVVERLLNVAPGEMLTAGRFERARRQLRELPSATAARLDYAPVPSGLAELRAVVAERPLLPSGALPLAGMGVVAAATQELRLTTGSIVGGGERISGAWRFWPNRRRTAAAIEAPAPWGGVWNLDIYSDRQTIAGVPASGSDRVGAGLSVSDWLTGRLRWTVGAGVDAWESEAAYARVAGRVRLASAGNRVGADAGLSGWFGGSGFGSVDGGITVRSSVEPEGLVFRGNAHLQFATDGTPLDLWWAGDTGHARPTLLRAHPLLEDGRLRVERLGRSLVHASIEAQRWWTVVGPLRAAGAAFGDIGRTARRHQGPSYGDIDVGVGARVAVGGMPGLLRVDVARGIRDGAIAASFAYEP